MKNIFFISALGASLLACATQTTSSACDASGLQNIVGMTATDALAEINKQPKSVQDMSIYSGSSETPDMLPKGKLVLEHSTPNVVDALMNGGTVTKVYCNN